MPAVSRGMTSGEIGVASQIFGTALDYKKVIVHNSKAYFFQPGNTAITPNGEVYFPEASYKSDFSANPSYAAWLIHELTHAWQHQQGMWVRTRGALNRNYKYGDLDKANRSFLSYGIEQQASIVGDYFRMTRGLNPVDGQGSAASYQKLIPFLPRKGR